VSSYSESELDEDIVAVGDDSNVSGSSDKMSSLSQCLGSGCVHPFIEGLSGLKIQQAPHVNKDSAPSFSSSWK
jgi:hypothetical protein